MIRVIDESYGEAGSESGYLYPVDYFEPFTPNPNAQLTSSITIHLSDYTKGARSRRLRQIHLRILARMDRRTAGSAGTRLTLWIFFLAPHRPFIRYAIERLILLAVAR